MFDNKHGGMDLYRAQRQLDNLYRNDDLCGNSRHQSAYPRNPWLKKTTTNLRNQRMGDRWETIREIRG